MYALREPSMSGASDLHSSQEVQPGPERICSVRISLASPDEIRSWSSGEVTRFSACLMAYPVGLTAVLSRDSWPKGAFSVNGFAGPLTSYRCACGKYRSGKKAREKEGSVCDRCGVLLAHAAARHRMGHIELAAQ